MIRIEENKLYMTAGETCYVVKIDGKALKTAHFGKRVEPEDDLDALFGLPDTLESRFSIDGKTVAFEYKHANVMPQKPMLGMGLAGGKTLQVTTVSGNITADIYYTPYPRGGFSRRVVVTNNGKKSITVSGLNSLRLRGETEFAFVSSDGKTEKAREVECSLSRGMNSFLAATDEDGGAYGFMCVYGDGVISGRSHDGVTQVDCVGYGETVLQSGESYVSPEILAVYSDNGIGGMSRVLHDVLRESAGSERYGERKPIVLFCPTLPGGKLVKAAGEAPKLGCDVFAVDMGEISGAALTEISAACKAAGIKLGVKLSPFNINKTSAVFNDKCVKAAGGVYSADLSSAEGAAALYSALKTAIVQNDIEYVMFDVPCGGMQEYAHGMHDVRYALTQNFPELILEWCIVPNKLQRGRLLCYPPCMTRFAVVPSDDGTLKASFDSATVGCLSYMLDPLSLTPDMVRAVRAQVFSYQDDAPLVMKGDLYVLNSSRGDACYMSVKKDKSCAYLVCERVSDGNAFVKLKGLDEHNLYAVREKGATFSGAALVSCGIPLPDAQTCSLHIRQVADYE